MSGLKVHGHDKALMVTTSTERNKNHSLYWALSLVLGITGLTLAVYGIATPCFRHDHVVGYRNSACWERKVGLWAECVKRCFYQNPSWTCKTWPYGMIPEDISIAGSLLITGLVCGVLGLLSLATRLRRWMERPLLVAAIFHTAAGLISAIGSVYLVSRLKHELRAVVDGMEGPNTLDSRPGLSFTLTIAASGTFLLAAAVSFLGWCKCRQDNAKMPPIS